MNVQEVYKSFAKTFGDRPFREQFCQEGDLVHEDAGSIVEDGNLVRVKNVLRVKELKVEFAIGDEDASKSFHDLERLYFTPAAKWLRKELGDRTIMAIPNTPHFTDTEVVNVRGLQMWARYNVMTQSHNFGFRVLAATPDLTEAEKVDAVIAHPFDWMEPGDHASISGVYYFRFISDDGMDCFTVLDEGLNVVILE